MEMKLKKSWNILFVHVIKLYLNHCFDTQILYGESQMHSYAYGTKSVLWKCLLSHLRIKHNFWKISGKGLLDMIK